jgi:hypothetical protein
MLIVFQKDRFRITNDIKISLWDSTVILVLFKTSINKYLFRKPRRICLGLRDPRQRSQPGPNDGTHPLAGTPLWPQRVQSGSRSDVHQVRIGNEFGHQLRRGLVHVGQEQIFLLGVGRLERSIFSTQG